MSRLNKFLIMAFLCSFSQFVLACSLNAGIAPTVNGTYVVQMIDNSSQRVLAQTGPISHGQSGQANFGCISNSVYAKFINQQNSYSYSSGPVFLANGQEASCALYGDYTVICKVRSSDALAE